ncbi:sortase domain-bontaining protein [Streptomyces sp. NPDC088725]|uniref:sortase domain-containing protein n=1 Tax=Streptomyces sp. NPDC088725 TaxID=3365873 RepID=UPI003814F7AC
MSAVAAGALISFAALCVVAAVLLYLFPHRPVNGPSRPSTAADAEPGRVTVTDPLSAPVRLRIPALRVSADVLALGVDAAGALEVPGLRSPMKVGWYALGPRPGDPGPAVLVGHRDAPGRAYLHGKLVDPNHIRNAVFAKLGRLSPGDRVETELRNGRRLRFRVTAVDTYPSSRFPTERVYGPVPDAQLRLITCGGVIDRNGHWDSNVVVSAVAAEP